MKFSFGQLITGKRLVNDLSASKERITGRLKDEIVSPLVSLPRQLVVGIIGSLFVATGLAFVLVGSLRLTQHFWAFQGNTSWLAYLVVWFEAVLIALFTLWRISARSKRKKSTS